MNARPTWGWIEESLFPLLTEEAARVGVDTSRWVLYAGDGPGRSLAERNPETGGIVRTVHRFHNPRDAEARMHAMRVAFGLVEAANRAKVVE